MNDLHQKLKSHLHYDPTTGHFTRLVVTSNRVKIGDYADKLHKDFLKV